MSESYYYLFPMIVPMLRGYDLNLIFPVSYVSQAMIAPDADLIVGYSVYSEGEKLSGFQRELTYRNGKFDADAGRAISLSDMLTEAPAFLEFSVREAKERRVFNTRLPPGQYSIYSKPGKKSFFSDNAPKYGSPPIISMIASFGKYVDGYPVVHLDRKRDFGESLLLINPYSRPIVANVLTHDGRELPRLRIPPISARWYNLAQILRDDENEWRGQVQITASNRLVTFETKHAMSDITRITDHEHLDPYRADPTHIPATLKVRIVTGAAIKRIRNAMARRSA